jgi:uncharacterized membrane protein YheB (UPF0754 family)
MEKITLKLLEFYNLDAELNGFTSPDGKETIVQGLLKERLSIVVKYWLNDLAKKVKAEREEIEALKNDLIKKYGKEDENGNISIPMFLEDQTVNPDYLEFDREFGKLLQTEKELEYKPLKLSDFDGLTTTSNYNTFFKLVVPE